MHCSNAVLPSSCCLFKTLCFLLSHPRVAFFGPTTTIAQRSESHNWQICTTVRTIFRCISYPSTTYKICREYFQLDVVLKNYYSKYCCTIQLRLYFVYNTKGNSPLLYVQLLVVYLQLGAYLGVSPCQHGTHSSSSWRSPRRSCMCLLVDTPK